MARKLARSRDRALQRRAEGRIFQLRGREVLLDSDLAEFYGVETRALVQQVKRNPARFPDDFAFQLTKDEWNDLRSQSVRSSWGGRRTPPWVFSEQGALQAAGVLRSGKADEVSVAISRAFVAMRERLLALDDFLRLLPEIRDRLEALEGDAAQAAESDADLHAKVAKLAEGLKSVTAVIKTMKKVDKALPPHA